MVRQLRIVPPGGPRPRPLTGFVLKVHSRCDLACDHCYVYQHADQGWREQPRFMAAETVRAVGERIAEHASAHGLADVTVVLHGGEPLLLGPRGLRAVLDELHRRVTPAARLHVRMQSNGILLTEPVCGVLAEFGVQIGISLDGDRAANDLHRRFADGSSSHHLVLRALSLLRRPRYRHLYGGLLCTVDLRADPLDTYAALRAESPPRIDFLLPHGTWDTPPPGIVPGTRDDRGPVNPYARWLLPIFDVWTAQGRPVPIRLFDSLLSTAAGGASATEWVGLDPVDFVVIETDGSYEQVDSLKTAYAGAAGTGLDVFTHSLDEVAAHPAVAGRQAGAAALCETCRSCPLVQRCGGGLLPHRFRSGSGFANPSVYCADLQELMTGMEARPDPAGDVSGTALPAALLDDLGAGPGSAANLRVLAGAEAGISRALVAAVHEEFGAGAAWAALTGIDARAPETLLTVLAHPYVRQWAVTCLRDGDPAAAGYLANIAVAAALRSRSPVRLEVPVHDGGVHLPSVGTALVDGERAVVAVGADGALTIGTGPVTRRIAHPDRPAPGWLPLRRLAAEGLGVLLDDGDPHRGGLGWPPAGRIDDEQARRWDRLLAEALAGLRRDAPEYLPLITTALRVLTPLAADPSGRRHSGTSRDAYGAIGVGPVDDGRELAVLLVHEAQHLTFGAATDVVDLVRPGDPTLVRVRWRPDPRPVEAALTGAYAHLGVAAVWHGRIGGDPVDPGAAGEFLRYRDAVREALDTIAATTALTDHGLRFTKAMVRTVESWSVPRRG